METTYTVKPYFHDKEIKYIIYRHRDGKEKFMFGNLTFNQAQAYLDCPEEIERQHRVFVYTGWGILAFVIISILIYFL